MLVTSFYATDVVRKTWTMTGPPEHRYYHRNEFLLRANSGAHRGVNTRALDELFEKSRLRSDEWTDVITVGTEHIYHVIVNIDYSRCKCTIIRSGV